MLDERDRRALEDIEQRLTAEDPAFARRMTAGGPALPVVPVLCLTVFLVLPFVAMFFGPAVALLTADMAAFALVVRLAWRNLRGRT